LRCKRSLRNSSFIDERLYFRFNVSRQRQASDCKSFMGSPANGRASERASCVVAGRAAEREACEWVDCVPPRPATFFASFGSFLKNENTTCQFLASSVVGEAMEQPAAAQRTPTVVDKSTVEASSSAPHTA